MSKIVMLTKQDCPKCSTAKMVLDKVLNNKYSTVLDIVEKELNENIFNNYVLKHNVMSLPVFICNEQVLKDTTVGNIVEFFKINAGF